MVNLSKPTITELYQNMNIKTGHGIKKKRLAEEIKEIALWNI